MEEFERNVINRVIRIPRDIKLVPGIVDKQRERNNLQYVSVGVISNQRFCSSNRPVFTL